MTTDRVVCEAQVPFVHGGAEVHVRELVRELRRAAIEPSWSACRSSGIRRRRSCRTPRRGGCSIFSESNGRPIDLVIAHEVPDLFRRGIRTRSRGSFTSTARPTSCAARPYSDFAHTERDVGLRDTLIRLDTEMLGECRRVFANAQNTAIASGEVQRAAGRGAVSPAAAGGAAARRGPLRRLRALGRPDRIGQAGRPAGVGDGRRRYADQAGCRRRRHPARQRRARRGRGRRRRPRRRSSARSTTSGCSSCIADALAVLYPPYDEDFGYVTLEAFLARKPVVTATDSGGPNEFVVDGVNGFVAAAGRRGVRATRSTRSPRDRRRAAALGDAGYERRADDHVGRRDREAARAMPRSRAISG